MAHENTAFFYGTLMAPGVLYRVCFGRSDVPEELRKTIRVYPALLEGYQRHRVRSVDYPGITPVEGASVLGTYATGLTEVMVRRLDIFEGSEYDRRPVRVKVLKGSVAEVHSAQLQQEVVREETANTYVFKHPESLETAEWDFERFKAEKLRYWGDESAEYADLDGNDEHDGTKGRAALLRGELSEAKMTEESSAKAEETMRSAV